MNILTTPVNAETISFSDSPPQSAIPGLVQHGEILNLILPDSIKSGECISDLLRTLTTGEPWLERFAAQPGNVLLLRRAYHKMAPRDFAGRLAEGKIDAFRGVGGLDKYLHHIPAGEFKFIVIDSLDGFLQPGRETAPTENSSAYEVLERHAERLNCSFIAVRLLPCALYEGDTIEDIPFAMRAFADTSVLARLWAKTSFIEVEKRTGPPIAPFYTTAPVMPYFRQDAPLEEISQKENHNG